MTDKLNEQTEKVAVVKPLEWVELRNHYWAYGDYQIAHCIGNFWRVRLHGKVICKRIKGMDKAQSWVVNHHENHTLSAITIRPASEVAAEARDKALREVGVVLQSS